MELPDIRQYSQYSQYYQQYQYYYQQYYQQQLLLQQQQAKEQQTKKRPARKQAKPEDITNTVYNEGGEYNIWYHKYLGDYGSGKRHEGRDTRGFRCRVSTDAGYSRGDKIQDAYICLYFARGKCILGEECTFLHRIPKAEDEVRLNATYDIFGRERHRTDREDMGGVGSFSRDNKTLYVGGLRKVSGINLEELVREQFSEWGEIENVRVIYSKNIAFVTYKLRSAAEFAKEAMADQDMSHSEVLNVRWANEDPNPTVQAKKEHDTQQKAVSAMISKRGYDYANGYQYDVYPNTDPQFEGAPPAVSYEYPYDPSNEQLQPSEEAVHQDNSASGGEAGQELYTDGNYIYDPYGQEYHDQEEFAQTLDNAEKELLNFVAGTEFPQASASKKARYSQFDEEHDEDEDEDEKGIVTTTKTSTTRKPRNPVLSTPPASKTTKSNLKKEADDKNKEKEKAKSPSDSNPLPH